MRLTILIATLFFTVNSCEKEFESLSDINQAILFQVEYTNMAWGYTHRGFIIDQEGVLKTFDKPKSWNRPDSLGYISSVELTENLNTISSESETIKSRIALKNFNKLQQVDPYALSEIESHMRDFGAIKYSGFIYDKEKDKFKEVVLELYGDRSYINTGHKAKQINKWLNKLYADLF